jgi:hypothetical protein
MTAHSGRDRPYKTLADAKLARSTINQCPNRSLTDD